MSIKATLMIIASMLVASNSYAEEKKDPCGNLFQVSTFSALLSDAYDGDFNIRQLEKHGVDGIGAFNSMDGDLIAVDGVFYQIGEDGKVRVAQPIQKTPFAQVVCFSESKKASIKSIPSYDSLKKVLDGKIKNKNIPHAIRVDGLFDQVKLSSSKEQAKPYKHLDEFYKDQIHYQIENTEGTLVGFWFPKFMGNVGVPGYHFHMINKERSMGGHLLDVKINNAKVIVQPINTMYIQFPHNKDYREANIKPVTKEDIKKLRAGGL